MRPVEMNSKKELKELTTLLLVILNCFGRSLFFHFLSYSHFWIKFNKY